MLLRRAQDSQRNNNKKKNMYNFVVQLLSADGPVILGAGTSAATVMTASYLPC